MRYIVVTTVSGLLTESLVLIVDTEHPTLGVVAIARTTSTHATTIVDALNA